MTKASLGVLILHGFSSSLDTVNGLVPRVEAMGVPYRMPVLRGHETRPEDLAGVRWQEWVEDAEVALGDLRTETDRVVVVGLSMGGLVALWLAATRPAEVDSVVAIVPAVRLASPIALVAGLVARVVRWIPVPPENAYEDRALARHSRNYLRVPSAAVVELVRFGRQVHSRLSDVRAPLLVLASRKDRVVSTWSAETVFRETSSSWKDLVWFERCGHEMLQDLEREAVMGRIEQFVAERRTLGEMDARAG